MNESTKSEDGANKPAPDQPFGKAPLGQQTFRFAGVELRPQDSAQDKIREVARADLWKGSIGPILVGVGLASALMPVEKALAPNYSYMTSSHPEPYPYVSHGLLFFYVGWALYWGLRDKVNADAMGEQHPTNQVLGGVSDAGGLLGRTWVTVLLGANVTGLLLYVYLAVVFTVLAFYSILGGGIYAFYKAVRESRK